MGRCALWKVVGVRCYFRARLGWHRILGASTVRPASAGGHGGWEEQGRPGDTNGTKAQAEGGPGLAPGVPQPPAPTWSPAPAPSFALDAGAEDMATSAHQPRPLCPRAAQRPRRGERGWGAPWVSARGVSCGHHYTFPRDAMAQKKTEQILIFTTREQNHGDCCPERSLCPGQTVSVEATVWGLGTASFRQGCGLLPERARGPGIKVLKGLCVGPVFPHTPAPPHHGAGGAGWGPWLGLLVGTAAGRSGGGPQAP